MKIKNLVVEGFRGFNENRKINFNERLSLIYGPNSYGKTSISEALEWLLFGTTSKVETPRSSKTEYKGSYRNCHYPSDKLPFVEATFIDKNKNEVTLKGELTETEQIRRYINGKEVQHWPWDDESMTVAPPFILQHALQDLLLTSPKNRYEGFSKIIGTDLLREFQEYFISLATKYNVPSEIRIFQDSFIELEENLGNFEEHSEIKRYYIKKNYNDFYKALLLACNEFISGLGFKS